jgi:tRNA(fMet)-specific endonuclease VapC
LSEQALSFMDKVVDHERNISFVTEIGLQSWNPDNQDDLKIYQFFISQASVTGVDNDIIQETIRIRKSFRLKLPDALIAATAITKHFTSIADNDKDFERVIGLKYLNPSMLTD